MLKIIKLWERDGVSPRCADPSEKAHRAAAGETGDIRVNNVRFWSMAAIVAFHSLSVYDLSREQRWTQSLQTVMLQAVKFGTIGFYFISGFLLGKRLGGGSAGAYFLRRLKKVGAPWAFWVSLFTLLPFTKKLALGMHSISDVSALIYPLKHRVLNALFFSPYWFVPNFLFALGFLLLCRRYRDQGRFGAALLCLSLFYGLNIYHHWVPVNHTTALGGYLFYLWLGHWASRRERVVFRILQTVKNWQVLFAVFAAGSLALAEACYLQHQSSGNIMNTLRLSNQVFSLIMIAALMKFRRATWPQFIPVRTSTFGLYLVHPVLGMVLVSGVNWLHPGPFGTGFWFCFGIWTATFAAYYGGSLLLTRELAARPAFGWIVGQWTPGRESREEGEHISEPAAWKATAAS